MQLAPVYPLYLQEVNHKEFQISLNCYKAHHLIFLAFHRAWIGLRLLDTGLPYISARFGAVGIVQNGGTQDCKTRFTLTEISVSAVLHHELFIGSLKWIFIYYDVDRKELRD